MRFRQQKEKEEEQEKEQEDADTEQDHVDAILRRRLAAKLEEAVNEYMEFQKAPFVKKLYLDLTYDSE